jgi:outer membrane protein
MTVLARFLGALALPLILGGAPLASAQDDPAPSAQDDPAPDEQEPVDVTPEPEPGPTPDRGAAGRSQPTLHGDLVLTLADAIRMGLENNLDVQVQRYDPYISWEENQISWGSFDPVYVSEFGWDKQQSPNANSLISGDVTDTHGYGGSTGLTGQIPLLGSLYQAHYGSNRSVTDVSIQELSPGFDTTWSVGITQPLLRNFLWSPEWTRVKTTRVLYEISVEGFSKDVMDTVQRIQNLYWNLIAREDQVRVAEKSLETAQALLDQTKTQHDVGVVSRVEVVEAEAGVAQRDFELIRAQNLYRNSQDDLIDAVLGVGLTADSTLQIRPTDRPDEFIPFDIDPSAAVESAFAHRPEVKQANKEIERTEIDLGFAKNQRLPSLDANVSYGNEGISGDLNPNCSFGGIPCPAPTVGSNWSNSMDHFGSARAAEQITARGLFSIPIPNTAARHRVSQAELEFRRANSQKRRLEQSIILEVRTAVRNLSDAQKGIEASRRARVAAEEQLRAERIRLEYGESTPFDVLLRESDLVQAQSEEINAFQVYRTSTTGLDRAQGTILRNNNISIDAVRALR